MGENIQFSKFASLCQLLENISSSNVIRDELAKFFKEIPPSAVKFSTYFLLRMIGPKYGDIDLGLERERRFASLREPSIHPKTM